MAKTVRLDSLIVELGLLPSRQAAQTAIMDGGILVNGEKMTKPGTAVRPDAKIEVLPQWQGSKYVSRGGLKLERALEAFQINVSGRVCLDLGASTGGFTDCLLQHGAKRVYAIDVGYGQLEWKLRQDSRVVVKERVNARYLTPDELYENNDERADLAVMDLSFISILKVLPAALSLMQTPQEMVALVKPQFEAGRNAVGKGGVVRDPATHADVLNKTITGALELGLQTIGITYSPIKGPAGNIEFLAHFLGTEPASTAELDVEAIVKDAHEKLAD